MPNHPIKRALRPSILAAAVILGFGPSHASTIDHDEDHDHVDGVGGVVSPAYAAGGSTASTPTANTREWKLDQIYGQSSFGGTPVDIRYNEIVEIAAPSLTGVTSKTELNQLFSLTDNLYESGTWNRTVSLYFVEALDYCGGYSKSYVGCSQIRGNQMAVERGYANGSYGAELIAHELGHAVGFYHSGEAPLYLGNDNLMAPRLNGDTTIASSQVDQLFGRGRFARLGQSKLLQQDSDGYYIEITPYVIVDGLSGATLPSSESGVAGGALAPVPAPAAGLLLLSGLAALGGLRRTRRT